MFIQENQPLVDPPAGAPAVEPPVPADASQLADLLQKLVVAQAPSALAPKASEVSLEALAYDFAVLKANVPAKVQPYLPKTLESLTTFLASPAYTSLVDAFADKPAPVVAPTVPAVATPPVEPIAPPVDKSPNFNRVGTRMLR